MTFAPKNFIVDIIDGDLASGKHSTVVTRFPPEPNGYLHIGHAKAICLNFGLAKNFKGRCHLRFDDTNPTTEDVEFVESIKRDIAWLGFAWGEHLYFASDYYQRLYEHAVELIKRGKAYVCSLNSEEIRAYRGTITEAGRNSPNRERTIEENLALFEQMKEGRYADGEHVLRAKIDMASPNMKMRDPPLYRIRKAHHYRTGDAWCIYPLYDFTHGLSDSYEGVTHSICTLEFENNREIYDWVLRELSVPHPPQQLEFARLNMSYTMMSKRKLAQLVSENRVSGWDDPRMPTLAGMRRRGIPALAVRSFCDMIGVARNNSVVDVGKFEFCIRDALNETAPRVMCVLRPLKVVLENYPADSVEELDAPYFPPDVGKPGSRKLPLRREIYIERDDFMEKPSKGFFRLVPGGEVRLRHGYIVRCNEVVKDDEGQVVQLNCSYDPATLAGKTPQGPTALHRKVKGTIHWVSAHDGVPVRVRIYDRLFDAEQPQDPNDLNAASLQELSGCLLEPAGATSDAGLHLQFERQGYFYQDSVDSSADDLVFNRTVTLRDTWAKQQGKGAKTSPSGSSVKDVKAKPKPKKSDAQTSLTQEVQGRLAGYVANDGLSQPHARQIAQDDHLVAFYEKTRDLRHGDAPLIAKWLLNDVSRAVKEHAGATFTPSHLVELIVLLTDGGMSHVAAKQVLAKAVATGKSPKELAAARAGALDASALREIVGKVIADHPEPLERYRGGKDSLFGFFVGQAMKACRGRAEPAQVKKLLKELLSP